MPLLLILVILCDFVWFFCDFMHLNTVRNYQFTPEVTPGPFATTCHFHVLDSYCHYSIELGWQSLFLYDFSNRVISYRTKLNMSAEEFESMRYANFYSNRAKKRKVWQIGHYAIINDLFNIIVFFNASITQHLLSIAMVKTGAPKLMYKVIV